MKKLIEALMAVTNTPDGSAQEVFSPRPRISKENRGNGLEDGSLYAMATSLSTVQIVIVGGNNQ